MLLTLPRLLVFKHCVIDSKSTKPYFVNYCGQLNFTESSLSMEDLLAFALLFFFIIYKNATELMKKMVTHKMLLLCSNAE